MIPIGVNFKKRMESTSTSDIDVLSTINKKN